MNLINTTKSRLISFYSASLKKMHTVSIVNTHPEIVKTVFIAIISIIIGIIVAPVTNIKPIKSYHIGDIARQTIHAPEDIHAIDTVGTKKYIENLIRSLPPVYRYNPFTKQHVFYMLIKVFRTGRFMIASHNTLNEITDKINGYLEKFSGQTLSQGTISFLYKRNFSKYYEDNLISVMQKFYDKYKIVVKLNDVQSHTSTGILLNTRGVGKSYIHDLNNFVDQQNAKSPLFDLITVTFPQLSINDYIVLTNFAENFIVPDVRYDEEATAAIIAKAKQASKPVLIHIRKGETIIREGEEINSSVFAKLKVLTGNRMVVYWYAYALLYAIITFISIFAVVEFSQKNIRKFRVSLKDSMFLSIVLLFTIIFARLSTMFVNIHEIGSFIIPSSAYYYAVPIAFGAMIVRLILNSEIAIGFSIIAGLLSSITVSDGMFIPLYFIISGIVGAHTLARCEQRTSIIKGGVIVGIVDILLVTSFMFINGTDTLDTFIINGSMAFLAGIVSAILVTGLTAVFESIFGYATDIKLLELANLENPLLKELFVSAPGSYYHSMMTATLAEAAASSIHANPLLSRTGSYYHDIGKIKMPDYFIENQANMANKHDKLLPSMSSLIIISHVKEGRELAKAYKIPDKIINIIEQHHGTSLVKFFYEKAKEKNGIDIKEEEFHYHGPKPQIRETGIVMLADAVEAASRTLKEPNPAQIKAMVEKIVNNKFMDGQLDECTLTLHDINEIKKSFIKILVAIFHKRVDYPGFKFNQLSNKTNGYSNIVPLPKNR